MLKIVDLVLLAFAGVRVDGQDQRLLCAEFAVTRNVESEFYISNKVFRHWYLRPDYDCYKQYKVMGIKNIYLVET